MFVRIAEPRWYVQLYYIRTCSASAAITTGYIHMRSSSAVNIIDLRSYALSNLVGKYSGPTFVHAARLPSTSLTCVRTHCTTLLVCTTVLHLDMRRVGCHYCWLHSYVLVICRQNRRPAFLHIRTSLVHIAALHSYVLLVCCQHRRPSFVCIAEPCWYPLLSFIRTHCSSAVYIVELLSHALQSFFATHCCPTFELAAHMPSTSLTYVCVLQNLVGTCCCPTFVRAACMLSTPLTCIGTCCRGSLVPTAVLHSHLLHVCRHYHWLYSCTLLVCCQHH